MVDINRDLIIKKFFNAAQSDIIFITQQKITKIDSDAFKEFTELEYLILDYNEIEELEVALFESLSKLRLLFFSDNSL
jgi:Leucine-rich repeat (LRR) protein